jgi:hypothetical protein
MAKARRRTPNSHSPSHVINQGALHRNHLRPGQCISCDHFISPSRGRLLDGYGRNTINNGYVGGAIYVDHASGKIFHFPQTDMTAAQTIRGKQMVERAAADLGYHVESYHSDNGIFASEEFQSHCETLGQDLHFCGVGAHHQNGIAKQSIQTVCGLARANLIHVALCWPERCDIGLWALALNYAVWIYNRLPNDAIGGLTPDEFWTSVRTDHADLRRAHVWGCPVYVLDPQLQSGSHIPKWSSRSRMGMFVGYSHQHSSLVPLVLNLRTGFISP